MSTNNNFLKSRLAKIILALAVAFVSVLLIEIFGRSYSSNTETTTELSPIELTKNLTSETMLGGSKLRAAAWNASFTERGLSLPEVGPRDGMYGERITMKACGVSQKCRKELSIPGIIEVDELGFQYTGNDANPTPNILIVGGSVAWGAGASDIENTYFAKLQKKLKKDYPDVGISVLATYASTGHTDLYSFVTNGLDVKPDIVIFLNGLNDITTKQNPDANDVSDFILNMKIAQKIAEHSGITTVFIRQPYPGEKINKTELEKRIIELSNPNYESRIITLYRYIGEGFKKVAEPDSAYYIDAAGCFDNETSTIFSDQWHFSDPGHELLAECIYRDLLPILKETTNRNESQ
jgi:lysophospholipase L1-like esterase